MSTYLSLLTSSANWTLALFLAWIVAAGFVGSLASHKSIRAFRWMSAMSLLSLLIVAGINVWRTGLLVQMAAMGLRLFPMNFALALVFLLPPVIAALAWSAPLLWKAVRHPQLSEIDPKTRAGIASPKMAAPVQLGLVGTFLAFLVTLGGPSIAIQLVCTLAWLAYAVWRWWRQAALSLNIEREGLEAVPRFWSRLARRTGIVLGFVAGLSLLGMVLQRLSRLPERYSMNMMQGGSHVHAAPEPMRSVLDFTGPKDGIPDRRFTLIAQKTQLTLSSGATIDALTYNGAAPGPELRVRQGELVEVTLQNRDVAEGVTIHWHGVNVPNAEDGVAGLTQDAVMPGGTFVYRFRANDAGTYWYHSHQRSLDEVGKGLFGPFIVEPREAVPGGVEIVVPIHFWLTAPASGVSAFGTATLDRKVIQPGSVVRLRLINTDVFPRELNLTGTAFRVTAIDGVDVNEPGELDRARLMLAAGGRYDLGFTMPDRPVLLSTGSPSPIFENAKLLFSADGEGAVKPAPSLVDFNAAAYGKATRTTVNAESRFDREYTFNIEGGLGFHNGAFGAAWFINGRTFPNTPHIMVREGDLIKMTFVNRSFDDHPMHPHGHRMLVLSRNGRPVTGSPWWTDSLNVAPGEIVEVALRADNPGLWMDHCHNLIHAAEGFIMHLMYDSVMTPFEVGSGTRNTPE